MSSGYNAARMSTLERLENWKQAGTITGTQYEALSALINKERFSLFLELNALLYLGVLSLVGGLAWTFSTHFERLGDVFILAVLSTMLAGSLYYCFSKAEPYSNEEVESPNFVFDYVVYLACLLLSVELGYIESRFAWLREAWDWYLLFSSIVFFIFAYRFDNRFVLSLALSALAAWFGVKINTRFGLDRIDPLQVTGLVYGSVVALLGLFLHRQKIKKHFLDTYLHIAGNVIFIALIAGLTGDHRSIYVLGLLSASAGSVVAGVRFKRFAFVVYGIVFGYIGISSQVLPKMNEFTAVLSYLVVTGSMVILLVVFLARRFGREE